MSLFVRWHIWLGWLVGVPMVLWTVSGFVMALKPIEEVRGDALRHHAPLLREQGTALSLPRVAAHDVISGMQLVAQADGPVWIVETEAGGRYRYAARSGDLIPPVIRDEALAIAAATLHHPAGQPRLTFYDAGAAPGDFRGGGPAWQVEYADGTRLYIDNATGEVRAVRTGWWRFYDFMWGLHIMDLQTREDSSHPVLIGFAGLAALGSLLGCALLFRRRKARVKAA